MSLDLLKRGQQHDVGPLAVVADRQIVACNEPAAAMGVRPDMKVSAALALCPLLKWRDRSPAGERAALADIASWAGQFTSHIALQPPYVLLLEVGGSVRYFNGLGNLMRKVMEGLEALGFAGRFGVAPTPQGAVLLARSWLPTSDRAVIDRTVLRERLLQLPVCVLENSGGLRATLEGIGADHLGDVVALPRAGVNRRFGPELLDELDRALGSKPDPRKMFTAPAKFETYIELAYPTANSEPLLFVCKRLFNQLEGFLSARRAGVTRLVLTFKLDHHPEPAVMTLDLLRPSDEALHFTNLLKERLARKQLQAPAERITLQVGEVVPLYERALSLLPDDPQQQGEALPKLLERLCARMGAQAVRGLRAVPDHRPECATVTTELQDGGPGRRTHSGEATLPSPRPFWLLTTPQPLREVQSVPQYGGPLKLLAGPERIESGWWDGADARRDYFVAETVEQSQVWVFRERRQPGGWFLHGLFA